MEPLSPLPREFSPADIIFYEEDKSPENVLLIPGMSYYPSYITSLECEKLLQIIENNPWVKEIRRRQQHYGYLYYHTRHNLETLQPIEQEIKTCLPLESFNFLIERMINDKIFPKDDPPTQCLVNEYIGNHRIASHFDDFNAFGDVIAGLSLLEPCYMTMKSMEKPSIETKFLMENMSLYVLKGESRYKWKHGITAMRCFENPRTHQQFYRGKQWRRISLTFRKILTDGTKKSYEGMKKDESCTW